METQNTPSGATPGGDSDEEHRHKLQKTPQFFQSAKKLFQDEKSPDGDLKEISSQLKSRLSSAFGKLKEPEEGKLVFTELTFESKILPTKVRYPELTPWTPSNSSQKLNLNLQTLQQSPLPRMNLSAMFAASPGTSHFQTYFSNEPEEEPMQPINIPSPDESLAHSALMVALSKERDRPKLERPKKSAHRRPQEVNIFQIGKQNDNKPENMFLAKSHQVVRTPDTNDTKSENEKSESPKVTPSATPSKLPRLNTALPKSNENEQDAVISLMALSSPRPFTHSRNPSRDSHSHSRQHSLHSISPSSPVHLALKPVLPPITGLIGAAAAALVSPRLVDDDATDEEVSYGTDEG